MFKDYASVTGPATFLNNSNGQMILVGASTNGATVVEAGDWDTTVLAFGPQDVNIFFGAGNNVGFGNIGNDFMFGGTGINKMHGNAGNDILARGEGVFSFMDGGAGDDIIAFGQNDQSIGGDGADHFVLAMKSGQIFWPQPGQSMPHTYITDLNFSDISEAIDKINLSMFAGVTRDNLTLDNNGSLLVYTPQGPIAIDGVAVEIKLIGGIDAAIAAGDLIVSGGYYGGKG
jgi:hypothetical protein